MKTIWPSTRSIRVRENEWSSQGQAVFCTSTATTTIRLNYEIYRLSVQVDPVLASFSHFTSAWRPQSEAERADWDLGGGAENMPIGNLQHIATIMQLCTSFSYFLSQTTDQDDDDDHHHHHVPWTTLDLTCRCWREAVNGRRTDWLTHCGRP